MTETEKPIGAKRTGMWYVKFVFAVYAASFGSFILLMVISLPFGGFEFGEQWIWPHAGILMSVFWFTWAPLIWRKLR